MLKWLILLKLKHNVWDEKQLSEGINMVKGERKKKIMNDHVSQFQLPSVYCEDESEESDREDNE